MTDEELTDALDGLYAYDTGCTDSGIHDETLRAQVIDEIWRDLGPHERFTPRLARIARNLYLTDDAIQNGYGLEDVVAFAEWLDGRMRPPFG